MSRNRFASTRQSAWSSRLLRSRKRQLVKPRSDDPPPSAGSMKNGIACPPAALASSDSPRRVPRLEPPVQREHPRVAKDRHVLDGLVVGAPEAEQAAVIAKVVERHAV